ncbi:PadR family transcriptional regulator [Nonomuraea angiospora]|uniref:PadR family transcriptional regulator n=1 Tax=Nonomuraea angiospora TaxID=46172 RepID=UPI0037931018
MNHHGDHDHADFDGSHRHSYYGGGRERGHYDGGRGYYEGGWSRGGYDGGWGRGGGRFRMRRGDVRAVILALLSEEPMHGYQLMQAIADRGHGRWIPSSGAIYPAISQLEDEGLVTISAQAGRKLVVLTDAGREAAQTHIDQVRDLFAAQNPAATGPDLRSLIGEVHDAARQIDRAGTGDQIAAAAKILSGTRRSMYLLLADATGDDHE